MIILLWIGGTMKKVLCFLFSFILITTLLYACASNSTKESVNDTTESVTTQTSEAGTSASIAKSKADTSWPRTITDATGHEVILEAEPKRISMLHTYPLEYFLALGVKPTATAHFNQLGEASALSESELFSPYAKDLDMIDLGSALEINLEAVLESKPDLIVTFAGQKGIDTIYDQLVEIAPVILIDYKASWQDQLKFIAEFLGKENEVDNIVSEVEGKIADANKVIEKNPERTFAIFRTDGKSFIALGGAAYYNTFKLTKPENFPAESMSLEAVADMNPYYIVFQHNQKSALAFVESMQSSPVGNSLDAVQNNRVYYFDENMNTFGPLTMSLAAQKLTEIYNKQ